MLKRMILGACSLCAAATLSAAEVDADVAARAAKAFARQNALLAEAVSGVGTPVRKEGVWVVPLLPAGYVALETRDTLPPIVAFSLEDFPQEPAPPLRSLLWRTPSLSRPSLLLSAAETRHAGWDELLAPALSLLEASPTIPTDQVVAVCNIASFRYAWDQCLPYNLYAPGLSRARVSPKTLDTMAMGSYGLRSACGCVATAVGQVAAWFQWPYALRDVVRCTQAGDAPAAPEASETGEEGEEAAEEEDEDAAYATDQVAAPGSPYRWDLLSEALAPTPEADFTGNEVGRFIHHWATLLKMAYDQGASGGTTATAARPNLLLAMGYKVVSPESVAYTLQPTEEGTWGLREVSSMDATDLARLYGEFQTALFVRKTPVPTGIAGHYIVCDGWAEEVDSALSADSSYARLNYGWGPDSGNNGWFALRAYDNGDGESVAADNKVFLQECFALLPLQCGELLSLPAQGPIPDTLRWYESPYWAQAYPSATRLLRALAFDESIRITRQADLQAAAESDANWSWEADSACLAMDARPGLTAGALLPELFHGGSTLEVELIRRTYTDDAGQEQILPDEAARSLQLFAEFPESGATCLLATLSLPEDEESGTFTCTLPAALQTRTYRLLLASGASPLDEDLPLDIPVDALAYGVCSLQVNDTADFSETRLPLEAPELASEVGALAQAAWPEALAPDEGQTLWLALSIQTDPDAPSADALWRRWEVAPQADAAPSLSFYRERHALNALDTYIWFDLEDDGGAEACEVKAYLSNAQWLDEAYRADGFTLTAEEVAGGFLTLEGRANTSPTALDALTLDNAESLGRDAVLSLRATDGAGNVSWAHCRLTWGLPESVVARGWQPLQSDRLAYALMHPGPEASAVLEPVHTAAEARALLENAALMNYDPEVLASILRASEPAAEPFEPRIELLSVSPEAVCFRLADGLYASATLARQVGVDPIALCSGPSLDALATAPAYSLSYDEETGVYTAAFTDAAARFFRLVLE